MKVLRYLTIGLAIGFVCTVFFMIVFIGINELTIQLLVWLLASAGFGLASMIFENEKLSYLAKNVIHFITSLAIVSTISLCLYRDLMVSVILCFVLAYIVIYFVMGMIDKYEVKKINEKLQSREA